MSARIEESLEKLRDEVRDILEARNERHQAEIEQAHSRVKELTSRVAELESARETWMTRSEAMAHRMLGLDVRIRRLESVNVDPTLRDNLIETCIQYEKLRSLGNGGHAAAPAATAICIYVKALRGNGLDPHLQALADYGRTGQCPHNWQDWRGEDGCSACGHTRPRSNWVAGRIEESHADQ